MKKKRWDTINGIVDRAMDLQAENRKEYIYRRCGGNEELKNQVFELLRSIEESKKESYLERPNSIFGGLLKSLTAEEGKPETSALVGDTIEHYKITELIEHGGMGSVFKAERTDGAYDKEVAIKLLRRGMETPANIARFERERNILANLDHPNITRLLDGGVTSEGLPFLVMDLVDGISLYNYCDRQKLSIEERLEIFKKVCRAVHHAHKNAVIHRDLKPSNIFITDGGVVKVLDFGIAKLLEESDRKEARYQTVEGARILTLRYAAPEMIEGRQVTTATDTYALGILLYELLTGVHPFNLEDKNFWEIEKHILEAIPEKPSVRLQGLLEHHQNEIAENRGLSSSELFKKLTGELDAIVMKAIRKDPEKRYSGTQQLLDDVERMEQNQPISAKENTAWYKTSKFFSRRKKEVIAVAVILIMVSGFTLFHTDQITEERDVARQEARRADDIASFLLELFDTESAGDTLTVARLLQQGEDLLVELVNQPAYADMLSVMGEAYVNFGEYEKAEELLEKAEQESERMHGDRSVEHANALYSMGNLHTEQREWQNAVEYLRSAYQLQTELLGDGNVQTAQTLSHLAAALRNLGELEQAEDFARRAVRIHNQISEPTSTEMLNSLASLAYVLRERDKLYEAESIYLKVLQRAARNSGVDRATLANHYNNLGYLNREQKEYLKAVRHYSEALEIQKKTLVRGHPEIINTRRNLATSYFFLDSLNQAENLFKENVSDIREKFSTNHWRTASAISTVGLFYLRNSREAAAEPYLRESVQIYRTVLGNDHLWTAYSEGLLAACLKFQNKNIDLADSLFQHHFQLFERDSTKLDRDNRHQIQRLIDVYSINGQNEQVIADYRELLD